MTKRHSFVVTVVLQQPYLVLWLPMVFGGLVCLWRAFDNGRFNTGLLHGLLVFHWSTQPSVLSIQSLALFGALACHCGIFLHVIDFLSRLPVLISGVSVDYSPLVTSLDESQEC
jgi:hypothetical protein